MLTAEEIKRSADVFSIELLDMQHRHRVLFGEDFLSDLSVPMHLHRAQLEYELREKTILLRQNLLATKGERQLWELLVQSFPTFTTLFRHVLIEFGEDGHKTKREAVQALSSRVHFDSSPFLKLLDVREKKADRKNFDVKSVASGYLAAIQQVTAAVDTMLDSPSKT